MLNLNDFHQYQHNATTMLYEHSGMLGIIPTGGGKTAVGLTAFSELQRDGFVRKGILLAPKRVAASVWPKEPLNWAQLVHLKVKAVTGTAKQRHEAIWSEHPDIHTLSINNIKWLAEECESWEPDDPRFDILIIDESSKFKNPRGEWAKTLRKLSLKFKTVWLLTGSPRPNSELDYFVAISVVSRNKMWGRSYDRWRRKNFFPTDFEQRVWEIHRHYVDEMNADVSRYSFKVAMKDVPRPASDPIIHEVHMPYEVREQYKSMERKLFATVSDKKNLSAKDIIAFNAAVSSGKLAQMVQGFLYDDEKVAHSMHHAKSEYVEDILDSAGGDASLLIYWFNEDLMRLKDLVPGLVYLGAGVPDKRALEIEDEWNAGNIERMAIHPASGGHGLNLQNTPAQLIHYALTWSAELYDQIVARVARQGYVTGEQQEWLVLNHHIVMANTIDNAKMSRVQGKLSAQQAAMEYIRSV